MSSYATLDSLNALLVTRPQGPTDVVARQEVLDLATDCVRRYCRRDFLITAGTWTYDAPHSTRLGVPDLRTLTGVTLFSTVIGDLTLFRKHPVSAALGTVAVYQSLEYRPGGVPTVWDAAMPASSYDPWEQIILTGTRGYGDSVPAGVAHVTRVLAHRAWQSDVAGNKSPAGPITPAFGPTRINVSMIETDPDLVGWLAPYRWEGG